MACILREIERIHEGTRYRIKDRNKALIYDSICKASGVTRKELVSKTGMRPSTVSEMVQQLVTDRLVIERGRRNDGMQGRPEVFLYPNCSRMYAIALYIVSRELKGVLVDAGGNFHAEQSHSLSASMNNSSFLKKIRKLTDILSGEVPEGSEILGVSLTIPGYVNIRTRTWSYAARWPKLRNVEFSKIEQAIGLPVVVNRSLDAELQYVMMKNQLYTSGGTLLFHWGYGIGAAYAYDGAILKTSFGSFCEIGHLSLYPDSGQKCTCGADGCLETAAALWAIIPELTRDGQSVPEDELAFKTFFSDHNLADHPSVKRAVEAIAYAVAILQTTFLPDRIVAYGPLLYNSRIFEAVVSRAKTIASPFAAEKLNFEFMDTTFDGDIIGGTSELFRSAFRKYLTAQ